MNIVSFKKALLDVNAVDASSSRKSTRLLYSFLALSLAVLFTAPSVHAAGLSKIFDELKVILKDLYDGIDGIVMAATVVVFGFGTLIRIFSRNQRSVDEATAWMKRACIALIVWKMLGIFQEAINGMTQGNEYQWN